MGLFELVSLILIGLCFVCAIGATLLAVYTNRKLAPQVSLWISAPLFAIACGFGAFVCAQLLMIEIVRYEDGSEVDGPELFPLFILGVLPGAIIAFGTSLATSVTAGLILKRRANRRINSEPDTLE